MASRLAEERDCRQPRFRAAATCAWLLAHAASAAAQTPEIRGLDLDVEGGPVTALAVALAPHAQLALGGEVLQSLARDWGWSAGVTAYLADHYAVRVRGSRVVDREANRFWDDRTEILEGWLDLRWVRRVAGFELGAGPTVGFARVSRPIYGESLHGFLAGAGAHGTRAVTGGVEIVLALDGLWYSFGRPLIAGPTPAGFDTDTAAHQVVVGVGLAYRWRRG